MGDAPYIPEIGREPISVLLVEDDPEHVRRLGGGLEAAEPGAFRVAHAAEVERALSLLRGGGYDVLLLDLTLPDSVGMEALARARAAAASVPIIVLGDVDDDALALQALRLGAQDHLTKSTTTPRQAIRAVRHAVERHRLLIELQEARRRSDFLATHDSLTQLPNRVYFQEQLRRSLLHARRNHRELAVLFLDLDRFKSINDTLGHPVGDQLLNQVARRLAGSVRRSDLVARIGGDEFILMLQDVNRSHAPAKVAQVVLESLREPYLLAGRRYWVTSSVGITVAPRDGTDPASLIRNADMALYHAKAKGRNNFQFYSEALNAAAQKRLSLERKLRQALERRQMVVYYQPKVEAATGRITGAEALLRWRDPERGLVPPSEFIPVCEETGLIVPLGLWCLRTACERTRAWHEAGYRHLKIAVNLSAYQIRQEGMRESIVRALWDTGLDASSLELELTESALMRSEGVAVGVLTELKQIGIGLSLDDFGTGFSSLSYLKRFPVDTVKIDRSFVSGLAIDPDDAAITTAILSIAEKLGLRAVAEGVETEEQCELLRLAGCDEMQGHLFSEAVPAEIFSHLLSRGYLGPEQKPRP